MAKESKELEQQEKNSSQARDALGRFLPGNKVGGRKALSCEVKEMLKAATVSAVAVLISTMNDESVKPELRVKCAEAIMDRVYGKSPQPIISEVEGGILITLSKELSDYAK